VSQKEKKKRVNIENDENIDAISRHDVNKDATPKTSRTAQGPRETKRPNSNSAEYRWVGDRRTCDLKKK